MGWGPRFRPGGQVGAPAEAPDGQLRLLVPWKEPENQQEGPLIRGKRGARPSPACFGGFRRG